jgi:tetratricopeptide (TPR) repeat protein
VGNPKQALASLFRIYAFHVGRSDMRRAAELVVELLPLSEQAGSPGFVLWAYANRSLVAFHMGDFEAGLAWSDRAGAYAEAIGYVRRRDHFHQDPVTMRMMHQGFAQLILGYPEQGLATHAEAARHARMLSGAFNVGFALSTCGAFAFARDTDEAASRSEEAVEIGRAHGYNYIEAFGLGYKGIACAQREHFDDAVRFINEGLEILAESATSIGNSLFRPVLAYSLGRLDKAEHGLREIDDLLSWFDISEERWQEAEAHRVKGELLFMQDASDTAGAEASFRTAIDTARRQRAKWWELRAVTGLARLWQRDGKSDEAHDLLAPVYAWFTEGFDTPDLKDAKALLDELR